MRGGYRKGKRQCLESEKNLKDVGSEGSGKDCGKDWSVQAFRLVGSCFFEANRASSEAKEWLVLRHKSMYDLLCR